MNKFKKVVAAFAAVLCGFAASAAVTSVAGEKLVSDGQTVVFLGDSITHYGVKNPYGYVPLSEICHKSLVRGVK